MGQPGFVDLGERYRGLDAKKDPLVVLNAVVPWEDFRAQLSAVWRKPEEERKTAAGRKPWDEVIIFKTLVLQALYNLSDDQIEYQIRDRLSFMRFLGLGLADRGPDATTGWLYREKIAQAGLVEALFDAFDAHLKSRVYLARGGQIVDASIVSAPVPRNSRAENTAIKDGHPPVAWTPNKRAQKDVDARWTKKHGKSYFGSKNHVTIDRKHKLMRRYTVTDAAVHDSQTLDALLDPHTFSIPTTPPRTCGPTPLIVRRRARRSSLRRACEAASTAGRAGESPYRSGRKRRTERGPKCARVSSTSSAISTPAWAARSCARSVSSEPRQRSA